MKKLALVLGSLLVVGTAVSAKEVMPAPVAAPERIVEVVEKPVIVYRDREVTPTWRPNGSVDVQYRWYGENENRTPADNNRADSTSWGNGSDDHNNASRLQTTAKINFTEKQSLEVRVRNSQTLRDDASGRSSKDDDQYRLRHFYNFGNLGTSKVNATSRLEYKQAGNDGAKHVEASVLFDFSEYVFSNQFFKADKLGFRTGYIHDWAGHGNGGVNNEVPKIGDVSHNKYILNFESEFTLPFGFSTEFNLYSGYDRARERFAVGTDGDTKKGEFYGAMEAYLYQHTPLYKYGNTEFSFDFEGGYDPYTFHQHRVVANDRKELTQRRKYELYMLPTLQVSYKPTDFVKLYAAAGAEYRNFGTKVEREAKNWRWQPTAWAGMKVTF